MDTNTSLDFNTKKGFICDMDGVIYHGNRILPGVAEFIQWLHDEDKEYLFLTNNSGYTPPGAEPEAGPHGAGCPGGALLYQRAGHGGLPEGAGLRMLHCHSAEAVMVGDRMDTDVISGMESGMSTVLVLSGVSTRETLNTYAYRPSIVLDGVGDIPALARGEKR